MRLWVDVLDAEGNRQAEGPLVAVSSASVSRVLDGAGSVSIELAAGDRRASELLQNKQRMVIYCEDQPGDVREIGRGIIDDINRSDSGSGKKLSASGPDILAELKYANTLLGRSFSQDSLSDVVDGLTSLQLGWTATASGTDNLISARYDGATVLKALQSLVELNGLHLRLAESGKALEVGLFGDDSGLKLINVQLATPEIYTNDDVALIESIKKQSGSEELITWLLPLAGGQNADSALTLRYSNRSSPYTIQSMTGPDGRTLYYIASASAIAQYGTIQKVGTYKEISPLSNTDGDIQNASNALFDAAAVTLDRYSVPQERFNLTVRKCTRTIRPGDQVRIVYFGDVQDERGIWHFIEIDDLFWVMKATEKIGTGGITLDLEVSSIDRYAMDTGRTVIGALESIRVQGISVQPSYNRSNMGPYSYALDSTHDITIPLKITNATFELDRCLLTVTSRQLRATARGALATPHTHTWASVPSAPPGTGGWANRIFSVSDGSTIYFFQALSDIPLPGATLQLFALNENPPHTHPLDYGLYTDTLYPQAVSVKVNGVTVASGLGTTSVGFTTEIDITEELVDAGGGLRQQHTILIECTGGQGEIEVQIELYDKITPFKLGS